MNVRGNRTNADSALRPRTPRCGLAADVWASQLHRTLRTPEQRTQLAAAQHALTGPTRYRLIDTGGNQAMLRSPHPIPG
jgi:uncharacterized protein (DUF3084 family)